METEKAALQERERQLLDRLRDHEPEVDQAPRLAISLLEADLRTIKLFRDRVLAGLLNDLRVEDEYWPPGGSSAERGQCQLAENPLKGE